MLCNEFDPDRKALIDPQEQFRPIAGFPEICVMAFSAHIVEKCLERYGGEQIADVALLHRPGAHLPGGHRRHRSGFEHASRGGDRLPAPSSRRCGPRGGKYFVFFGAAGVLDRNIPLNSFILPTAAGAGRGALLPLPAPGGGSGPGCRLCRRLPGGLGVPGPALYPGQNLDHRTPSTGRPGARWSAARPKAACPWRWSAPPWRQWPSSGGCGLLNSSTPRTTWTAPCGTAACSTRRARLSQRSALPPPWKQAAGCGRCNNQRRSFTMAKIATFYDHIVDISRQENMFVVDALKLARELGVEACGGLCQQHLGPGGRVRPGNRHGGYGDFRHPRLFPTLSGTPTSSAKPPPILEAAPVFWGAPRHAGHPRLLGGGRFPPRSGEGPNRPDGGGAWRSLPVWPWTTASLW